MKFVSSCENWEAITNDSLSSFVSNSKINAEECLFGIHPVTVADTRVGPRGADACIVGEKNYLLFKNDRINNNFLMR